MDFKYILKLSKGKNCQKIVLPSVVTPATHGMDTAVSSRALHVEGLREGKLLGFSHPAPKYNALGMVLLLGFTDTGMRAQMRKT